ncbi:MAG TPA: class I SAM-dependent methyltransferase [Alphaproteobacteria bacterium]|nr:class I SAM-dependent methyltransferase [Alphaproteobacteria bacterium]
MTQQPIRFDDGEAYERAMGIWSRLAGDVFLDWLAPPSGQRWLDVGCGNGAFTELLIRRCAPSETHGIDPSEAQLAFARARPAVRGARFLLGDAMGLPFDTGYFDVAVMALVIFFVPDPARCVAEMVRVVRPGGVVATYAWDMLGGGFPFDAIRIEMSALGVTPLVPPSINASRMEVLHELWLGAGLQAIETREIPVQRTFADFDDFWNSSTITGGMRASLAAMARDNVEVLRARVRSRLPTDARGRITYRARANAIRGRVPRSP